MTSHTGTLHLLHGGTKVSWVYRSGRGHGTILGVHKKGTTHDNTEYSIREHDHHPGEPPVVYHYGSDLTVES